MKGTLLSEGNYNILQENQLILLLLMAQKAIKFKKKENRQNELDLF